MNSNIKSLSIFGVLALTTLLSSASASEDALQNSKFFQALWGNTSFYQNEQKDISIKFIGRYHGQAWSVDADQGSENGYENRRQITGFQLNIDSQWKIAAQMYIGDGGKPFYDGMYELMLGWKSKDKNTTIAIGRLDYLYTGLERSTSSKRISTLERSMLVNQLMPGEAVGVHFDRQEKAYSYHLGIFAGDINDDFSNFSAGYALATGVSLELPLVFDEGKLYVDYLFNNGFAANNAFAPYEHIISTYYKTKVGKTNLNFDITWAKGIGDVSDVRGVTLLLSYDLFSQLLLDTDFLQVNFRYHQARGGDPGALSGQRRYEHQIEPVLTGKNYRSFYAGTSYKLYSNYLKLMAGVEWARLSNSPVGGDAYKGATYSIAIRTYW